MIRAPAEHSVLAVDVNIFSLSVAVCADRQKIDLILRNLLENAVSFTRPLSAR